MLHGGSYDDDGHEQFGDAWLFKEGSWSPLPLHTTEGVWDDHVLAYHHAAGVLVMIGGVKNEAGLLTMGESGWEPADATPPLPRHQCAAVAYDRGSDRLVFHGGEAHHRGPQSDETLVLGIGP